MLDLGKALKLSQDQGSKSAKGVFKEKSIRLRTGVKPFQLEPEPEDGEGEGEFNLLDEIHIVRKGEE